MTAVKDHGIVSESVKEGTLFNLTNARVIYWRHGMFQRDQAAPLLLFYCF